MTGCGTVVALAGFHPYLPITMRDDYIKEALKAVGGLDNDLRIAMDLDLSFRLFMRFPVAYLDQVVFFYRRHEGNIGRNHELRLLENIRVIEKLLDAFPSARSNSVKPIVITASLKRAGEAVRRAPRMKP